MIQIHETTDLEALYRYHTSHHSPHFFPVDFSAWKKSFLEDVDGEGIILFRELFAKAAYHDDELIGFIQYGTTAFGFDAQGEISSLVSYPVIRNLYFNADKVDAGQMLLRSALEHLQSAERVYAFFHYFGMSCFARHGKLFQAHSHIETLLKEHGFVTEHENVYYSSVLKDTDQSEVEIKPYDLTKGGQQYIDFILAGSQVGGCEVHYVDDRTTYLRWIYINGDITGKGIGTRCMNALKQWLYRKGCQRFDTDTAATNLVAQHYYEKNGFTREGITRSYYQL